MTPPILNDRMTPEEVSAELGVTTQALEVWRSTRRYPLPHYKLGRRIFYRRSDVEAFIESRRLE